MMSRFEIPTKHKHHEQKEPHMATKKNTPKKCGKKIAAVTPEMEWYSLYSNNKKPSKDTEIVRIIVGKGLPKCIDAERFLRNVFHCVAEIVTLLMDEHKQGKKCNDCGKTFPVDDGVLKKQILALRDVGLSIKAIAKQVHKSDRFVAKVVKGACK